MKPTYGQKDSTSGTGKAKKYSSRRPPVCAPARRNCVKKRYEPCSTCCAGNWWSRPMCSIRKSNWTSSSKPIPACSKELSGILKTHANYQSRWSPILVQSKEQTELVSSSPPSGDMAAISSASSFLMPYPTSASDVTRWTRSFAFYFWRLSATESWSRCAAGMFPVIRLTMPPCAGSQATARCVLRIAHVCSK